MPCYTFIAPAGQSPITVELRDNDTAWAEAVRFCGEMLRDIDGDLPSRTDWQITVTSETGQLVAEIEIGARRYTPLA
jgi:hypothetical protein